MMRAKQLKSLQFNKSKSNNDLKTGSGFSSKFPSALALSLVCALFLQLGQIGIGIGTGSTNVAYAYFQAEATVLDSTPIYRTVNYQQRVCPAQDWEIIRSSRVINDVEVFKKILGGVAGAFLANGIITETVDKRWQKNSLSAALAIGGAELATDKQIYPIEAIFYAAGGIIGATALGHKATAIGAIGASIIGEHVDRQEGYSDVYTTTFLSCQKVDKEHEQLIGYKVHFEYNNSTYQVMLDNEPGDYLYVDAHARILAY